MHSLWEGIESKSPISAEEQATAVYLRQVFDYFLWWLAKSAPANEGTFKNPLALTSVEEPHMQNAIRNKSKGKPYSEGAWMFSEEDIVRRKPPKDDSNYRSRRTTKGKRKSRSEGNSGDSDLGSMLRSRKRIKLEQAAPVSLMDRHEITSDVNQQTIDPQTTSGHHQSADPEEHQFSDPEEQSIDGDLIDNESTFSRSPSTTNEELLPDSATSNHVNFTSPVAEGPPRLKRAQFVTMFDEAVPILQAILDDMPISPEDLERYPDLEEKSAALAQWAQRKEQGVRLLGAMQKAYLSVMVASEPEVDNDLGHAERAHSTEHDDDEERSLKSNDPHPSQGFPSDDILVPSTSSSVDKPIENSKQPGKNEFKRDRAGRFARSRTSKKRISVGIEKANAEAMAFVVSPFPSRDDGFWAAFGY